MYINIEYKKEDLISCACEMGGNGSPGKLRWLGCLDRLVWQSLLTDWRESVTLLQ